MTEADREFFREFRRAMIILARAAIKRFGVSWDDFLPRDVAGPAAGFVKEGDYLFDGHQFTRIDAEIG